MAKNFHFISIGGSVMHNLAMALKKNGFHITGSDDQIYDPAYSRLKKYGLLPQKMGWDVNRIHSGLDAIILGMHAKEDNPELRKAKELKLPIYSFPEFIYEQTKNKKRIVVAGSHGKTTITSMLLHIFREQDIKINYLVGAQLKGFDTMVNLDPDAEIAVFEGDEYLASALEPVPKFLFYKPHIAIISGIAWDHINAFPTYESYLTQFEKFIHTIPHNGYLIYNEEDPELEKLVDRSKPEANLIPYSTPPHQPMESVLQVEFDKSSFKMPMIGTHNASNVMSAKLAAQLCDIDEAEVAQAMESFSSPAKRLEIMHQSEALTIIRDFAHAPSKVGASVNAVKAHFPNRHFIALMELHTFSSLMPEFLKQYNGKLSGADQAMIYLNPHALKTKGSGVNEAMVKKAFDFPGLMVSREVKNLHSELKKSLTSPAVILLMSSGNWGGEDWSDLPTFVHPE